MIKYICYVAIAILSVGYSFAQIPVNAYGSVISVVNNTLHLSNVTEQFDTYEDGERVLIIQIQDDVIGNNTRNNSNFGNLGNIQSAGEYEFATIASHVETNGVPSSITLSLPLTNTYRVSPNSRVQIVSYPQLGSPDFTSTQDITGLPWNGETGGIVAFQVTGTFTLNHNIIADGIGFRGGFRSANHSGPTNCTSSHLYISNTNQLGLKGEGIYKNTSTNYNGGRAKILNGGGGGSHHNAGGGGGGNFSDGGLGGPGYNGTGSGCSAHSSGGTGGMSLATYIVGGQLYLGGGGGGGQQNNFVGTDGGSGGGLIFIRANELRTNGACSGHRISANGLAGATAGNDGAGGGGAGGTIVLVINNYTVPASCGVQVTVNGGNGGNANNIAVPTGGGGGGGQGAIVYSLALPPATISLETNNGIGGCNDSRCNSIAGNGMGINNMGIIDDMLLPIELTDFDATLMDAGKRVLLTWETASEFNNESFVLERSGNGLLFEPVYQTPGRGTSQEATYYTYTDNNPLKGSSYYRLRQIDFDGKTTTSDVVAVDVPVGSQSVSIYPNPAREVVRVNFESEETLVSCQLYSVTGILMQVSTEKDGNLLIFNTVDLPRGVYLLRIQSEEGVQSHKIILE